MVAIIRRALLAPLVLLNLVLYIIMVGLASWALDRSFNYGYVEGGNAITVTLVIFSLISGVVGIASALSGMHHVGSWRTDTYAAAAASGLIAWLLTLLTFGIACKHIRRDHIYSNRLKALEAFPIILAVTQWLYLLMLYAGFFGRRLGGYKEPGYTTAPPPAAGPTIAEQKAAASAV